MRLMRQFISLKNSKKLWELWSLWCWADNYIPHGHSFVVQFTILHDSSSLHLSRHTCDNIFAMAIPGYSKVQNFEQIEYTVMLNYREANFIYGATSAQWTSSDHCSTIAKWNTTKNSWNLTVEENKWWNPDLNLKRGEYTTTPRKTLPTNPNHYTHKQWFHSSLGGRGWLIYDIGLLSITLIWELPCEGKLISMRYFHQ